jgi:hypothetical protein
MNGRTTITSAVLALSLCAALPAGAQERHGGARDRGRAAASAPAPRQQDQPRAVPRQDVRPQTVPRQGAGQYRQSDQHGVPPAYHGPSAPSYGRAVPRSYQRPYDSYPGYARPHYYSRPYARPHGYVPYRPYYFPRPYYSFRPHLSIGFGLWIGDSVPYPYAYLGPYTPRVYGYYPNGAYVGPSVSVYGGVSFDLQPPDADVFVDGEYVGNASSFSPYAAPLTLTPGQHRIAVQREGFRPMEWDVVIQPGQVIPYRGAMQAY